MYNESIKKIYIDERELITVMPFKFLQRLFNTSEPFEIKYGKDASEFTFYEIRDMYKVIGFESLSIIETFNSQMKNYTSYCINQNYTKDTQNHYAEFNRQIMAELVDKLAVDRKIITREELNRIQERLYNPSDQFILEALFCGIGGKEYKDLSEATIDNIHGNIFSAESGDYIATDALIKYAYEANSELTYYSIGGEASGRRFPLKNENRIIKGMYNNAEIDTEKRKYRRIYTRIIRILNFCGESQLSGHSIMVSGQIHYINQRCKELGITGEEYLFNDEFLKELQKRFNKNISRATFLMNYRDYLVQ